MISFSCAHAQNTLVESTQTPESSFFSFKMPGLPTSWLSCVPGYMSVLKGKVSDCYERFSQTTAQIKIADHKELIVGTCAVCVVGYLAYCGVAKYRHSYWQNEYKKKYSTLVDAYTLQQKELYRLIDNKLAVYRQIQALMQRYNLAHAEFTGGAYSATSPYKITIGDFMSALAPTGNRQTYALHVVTHYMTPEEREVAKELVLRFAKIASECREYDDHLKKTYYAHLRAFEQKLGIELDKNPFVQRYARYYDSYDAKIESLKGRIPQSNNDDTLTAIRKNFIESLHSQIQQSNLTQEVTELSKKIREQELVICTDHEKLRIAFYNELNDVQEELNIVLPDHVS